MSNAHRPTWNPAQGREQKGGSRQYSVKDLAAHTKLKFRQPGQTSTSEVSSSDLRVQLLIAERKAVDKKRKAQGLGPLPELVLPGQKSIEGGEGGAEEDGERAKRRKVLEEAVGLDRDDEDDEAEDDDKEGAESDDGTDAKGKEKAEGSDGDDDDDDDDDSDDDEDDTAELLRELEKIKRERAEEKERQEAALAASNATSREAEIAVGNPLLNLAAALGQAPSTPGGSSDAGSSATGSFRVGRRWDDDLIFKNQAAGTEDKNKKKEFVNDLLRTEFHRKFMGKFIK